MLKKSKVNSPLFKIKSKFNSDTYYTSKDFPEKIIDGITFVGAKRSPSDKRLHFIMKDMFVKVSNE